MINNLKNKMSSFHDGIYHSWHFLGCTCPRGRLRVQWFSRSRQKHLLETSRFVICKGYFFLVLTLIQARSVMKTAYCYSRWLLGIVNFAPERRKRKKGGCHFYSFFFFGGGGVRGGGGGGPGANFNKSKICNFFHGWALRQGLRICVSGSFFSL